MRHVQQKYHPSTFAKALICLQYRHLSHVKGIHSLAQSATSNCVSHHSGTHLQSSNRQGSETCAGSWVRQTISFAVSEKLKRRAQACMATATPVEPSKAQPQAGWPLAAVATMTSIGDQEANFATCERLAKEARVQNAQMLFLPECCSFIGSTQQETVAKAQPLDGPLMQRYQDLARQQNIWLSLGGFQEKGPDPEHMYNCHVIISSNGDMVAAYRKVHLFNVDVPNGPVLMESRSTSPGAQLVACDSPVGRLGVTICYDLRFPEVYQQLTFQHGAQILLMPSAFTKVTGEAHWELLLRTRAVECQCYVIAAAQAGKHNEKRESYGHSLIIDPWGRIIGRQEDPMATGIAVAPIDISFLASVRQRMPIAEHRKQGRTCLGWGVSI